MFDNKILQSAKKIGGDLRYMKKAVFLDRDGTINVDVGYLSNPSGLVFIRGAKEGISLLKDKGFLVFIVTNQSGVGRGYFSLETLKAINERLLHEFNKFGIHIDGVYYCPHHPRERCKCRKPQPKIVRDITQQFRVDLEHSYFVGDKLIDVQTGKNAGCRTVLINADTSSLIEEEDDWTMPDFVAKDLREAARWIVKNSTKSRKKRKKISRKVPR